MTKAVWTKFITDNAGAVVEGASVTVFLSDGITPAEIFSDPAGSAKANPFLTPAGGKAEFYADPGIYVIQASKDGKTATWNNEEIGHARRDLDLLDLGSAATARTNLGLGTAATKNVTTTATDTTAGSLLKVGDFGIGAETSAYLETGGDTITNPTGSYRFQGDAFSDRPFGGAYTEVRHVMLNNESAFQLASAFSATPQMKFRVAASGVWGSWQEIYHTGNILGTVSQSGGVPTGAVIERGSNANGEYTKLADGTLICWRRGSIGGGFASGGEVDRPWTFPATFSVSPTVPGFMYGGSSAGNGVAQLVKSLSTTSVVMRVKNNTLVDIGTLGANTEHCFAIGRWY